MDRGTTDLAFEVPNSQQTEQLLWWIARATAPLVGEEFFRMLVTHLASGLGLSVVFIAECLNRPTTRVRTLAFWERTGLRDNVEFDLKGTPCEETIRDKRVCWIPSGVEEKFPAERGKDRACYYGIPIFEAGSDNVIGHVAFFDKLSMERNTFDNPLFHIFATRAAAELQRRHAEDRANEHLDQLAHLSRIGAMSEMASVIAHEINQPLATILTNSEVCLRLMEQAPNIPPDVVDAMSQIASEADRAGAILRSLREFVRKGRERCARADINQIVVDAASLARIETKREHVQLTLEIQKDLPAIRGDSVQLKQVVLNLIRNSVEALREGSTKEREILVRTARVPMRRIEVSVHDTGPGVDNRLAERVFEPFFSTKSTGMGVGLAIGRSIIESHGGKLWVDAGGQGGATFRFYLPIEREEN